MKKKQSFLSNLFGRANVKAEQNQTGKPSTKKESKQLAVIQSNPIPEVSPQKIIDFMNAFGLASELDDNEKQQFSAIAIEFRLNPFKREVHCVPYGQGEKRKLSIITGYEVYIKRADRSGKLAGWKPETVGEVPNLKAIVTIHRKDWNEPLVHEAFYSECVQTKYDGTPTYFWKKMPKFMLKKVCISQAFRLAFPDELGGMPYTADELPEEMTTVRTVSEPKPKESYAKPENITEPRTVSDIKADQMSDEKHPISTEQAVMVRDSFIWKNPAQYTAVNKMIEAIKTAEDADKVITLIESFKLPAKKADVEERFDKIINKEIKSIQKDFEVF